MFLMKINVSFSICNRYAMYKQVYPYIGHQANTDSDHLRDVIRELLVKEMKDKRLVVNGDSQTGFKSNSSKEDDITSNSGDDADDDSKPSLTDDNGVRNEVKSLLELERTMEKERRKDYDHK